jgi:uncharacterized protein YcgL (UPF0745 family)
MNFMQACKVYRSDKKAETYLYLAEEMDFEDLPDELRQTFGEPAFVMRLELTPEFRLARVATQLVLEHLKESGFYLQLPPELSIEEEISRNIS